MRFARNIKKNSDYFSKTEEQKEIPLYSAVCEFENEAIRGMIEQFCSNKTGNVDKIFDIVMQNLNIPNLSMEYNFSIRIEGYGMSKSYRKLGIKKDSKVVALRIKDFTKIEMLQVPAVEEKKWKLIEPLEVFMPKMNIKVFKRVLSY